MRAIRTQFFLSFAVMGSLVPLLSVFLWEEAHFSRLQIGLAMALTSLPMLFSPALITLLADRQVDSRRILALAFVISGLVLTGMYFSQSAVLTMGLFIFHGLAFVAMIPLQDGFYFSYAGMQRNAGHDVPPYPLVRVFGTLGFILPSLILFFLIERKAGSSAIVPLAVSFCVLSICNSFFLPKLQGHQVMEATPAGKKRKLPTTEALAVLFSPEGRYLAIGLALAYTAAGGYYAFISLYLRQEVGIPRSTIGLIICTGVVIEVIFTLNMPRIHRWLRLKGILVLGLALMSLRMFLIAFFPVPWLVVTIQAVHGMEVMALYIAPIMFLDRLAGDRFRNSIQGVWTMAIGGGSRVAGCAAAGFIAEYWGLNWLLIFGGCLTFGAMTVVALMFKPIRPREDGGPASQFEPPAAVIHGPEGTA